ncbi:RNA transcription, translation and transport factor protein [Galendromus occidentalis]|uniref:RNA transcription, translation and transport factor protein n=1 Tax=Galendromus occidentalis TaxID=34638 RepID=A0AAJ6QVC3_9ACAR|nr:RNA transcription, translation and transport factor protein [Galendromus occidentalis]
MCFACHTLISFIEMFRRKLEALDFPHKDDFDTTDDEQVRKLAIWLEEDKLRLHTAANRGRFSATSPSEWKKTFAAYLKLAGCPFDQSKANECVDWLLGLAVRNDYMDNADDFSDLSAEKAALESDDPLAEIQYDSPEFKDGVDRLAALLNIQPHPEDPSVTLRAVAKYSEMYLSVEARGSTKKEGKPLEMSQIHLGFDLKDPVLNGAAKILRLLFIEDVRNLQTRINEAIVAVQSLTADPRTDTRLAHVGRS